MANDFDADRLRRLIGDNRWGRSIDIRAATSSTMDDAATAAAKGAPDGHVVLADTQTRGRGAHGRPWVSPPGSDLYFSVVARPTLEPAATSMVTLAAGLGVRDAVAAWVPGATVLVKWPNDVWIGRRKCSGILVESRTVGTSIDSIVIGVGVNVNRLDWPDELSSTATSLRAERVEPDAIDRERVFVDVLSTMENWVGRLEKDGARGVVHALEPRLALMGQPVQWESGVGIFEGIDRDGAARVKIDGAVVTLHAAHLRPVDCDDGALA